MGKSGFGKVRVKNITSIIIDPCPSLARFCHIPQWLLYGGIHAWAPCLVCGLVGFGGWEGWKEREGCFLFFFTIPPREKKAISGGVLASE